MLAKKALLPTLDQLNDYEDGTVSVFNFEPPSDLATPPQKTNHIHVILGKVEV